MFEKRGQGEQRHLDDQNQGSLTGASFVPARAERVVLGDRSSFGMAFLRMCPFTVCSLLCPLTNYQLVNHVLGHGGPLSGSYQGWA